MLKKKILIFILSVALVVAGVLPVSAVYVTLSDNGVRRTLKADTDSMLKMSSGTRYENVASIVPFFAFDTLEPDTTYTLTYTATISMTPEQAPSNSYYLHVPKYYNGESLPSKVSYGETLDGALIRRSSSPAEAEGYYNYTYEIIFNTAGMTNLSKKYIFVQQEFVLQYLSIWSNNWGFSAEYDPDQSYYMDQIAADVAQIKQDNENFYSNAPEIIKNALSDHDQDVKTEASTEGNDNITEATSALTDALPIASISDALAPLVTACSYNGTKSIWTFPELSIPAISGLFGEMKLSEKQDFDLTEYAELYIPDQLLTLIRAVTTLLLIIWAIKECQSLFDNLLGGNR